MGTVRRCDTVSHMKQWVRTVVIVLVVVLVAAAGGRRLVRSTDMQLFGDLVNRGATERKVVALTFDDGPTCPDVDAVLAATQGVPVTYFLLGSEIATCPEGARRIHATGAQLGNHTWSHRRMVFVSPTTVAGEIESTDEAIRGLGYSGDIVFRPPYGKKLAVLPLWLEQHQRLTVMWDVAPETWDGRAQGADELAREAVAATRPGSIILLHPWNSRTEVQKAIPLIIRELRQQGYTFVTVEDLLDA